MARRPTSVLIPPLASLCPNSSLLLLPVLPTHDKGAKRSERVPSEASSGSMGPPLRRSSRTAYRAHPFIIFADLADQFALGAKPPDFSQNPTTQLKNTDPKPHESATQSPTPKSPKSHSAAHVIHPQNDPDDLGLFDEETTEPTTPRRNPRKPTRVRRSIQP